MKCKILYACVTCLFSSIANAESPVKGGVLFSIEKTQGSMWTSTKSAYFKSFDAMLLNGGENDIELKDVCYKAYDSIGNAYKLDTIDERLSSGILKAGESISGFYQFSSDGEGVYDASVVKLLRNCK